MTITRLTTTTALARAWRNVTHGRQFLGPSVWLMLLDADHRPVQPVIELEDAGSPPAPHQLATLTDFLGDLALRAPAGHCQLAVLRSRPGRGMPSAEDRAWAAAMHRAAGTAQVSCLGAHFANDEHLLPLPVPLARPRTHEEEREGLPPRSSSG